MTPIGVNGWYLFYTNAPSDLMIQQNVNMLTFAFTSIILLVLIFLIYSLKLIQNSNRNLNYAATHDSLTGAANFSFFERRLMELLPEKKACCIAALNIHQFKFINEIFGSQYGDALLCAIKSILDTSLGDGEFFCRYNADAFYLFLNGGSRSEVTERIQDIFDQISHWSWQNQKTYQIMMYAGVVRIDKVSEYHDQKPQSILIHLLFALDKAKSLPANTVWFFDTELHEVEKLENYIQSHMQRSNCFCNRKLTFPAESWAAQKPWSGGLPEMAALFSRITLFRCLNKMVFVFNLIYICWNWSAKNCAHG